MAHLQLYVLHCRVCILTGEAFCFGSVLMKSKFSTCDFTHLMFGRIYYRFVYDSVHFKPFLDPAG